MADAGVADRQALSTRWRRFVVFAGLAAAALIGTTVAFLANVEVADEAIGTRSCGSVFDSVVDRSGWEDWWARDLDEAPPGERSVLLRTTECPSAVNRQLLWTSILLAVGVVAGMAMVPNRSRRSGLEPSGAERLHRLGRSTLATGVALGIGGVASLVVLVADAESTLFLYVERTVVVVIGLVALVPAFALIAIGRAMMVVAPELDAVAGRRVTGNATRNRETDT